jgi:hypothetical protein
MLFATGGGGGGVTTRAFDGEAFLVKIFGWNVASPSSR